MFVLFVLMGVDRSRFLNNVVLWLSMLNLMMSSGFRFSFFRCNCCFLFGHQIFHALFFFLSSLDSSCLSVFFLYLSESCLFSLLRSCRLSSTDSVLFISKLLLLSDSLSLCLLFLS